MFKRLLTGGMTVGITFEDRHIEAEAGDSVAAALLSAGIIDFRQSVESTQPRGPYCLIGNCFDCLLEIDGVANLQACRTRVREGMQIRRQRGLTRLETDCES